jgi:ssDNA-binding Zn-finger/Zn-ribbon topoisomerase 1
VVATMGGHPCPKCGNLNLVVSSSMFNFEWLNAWCSFQEPRDGGVWSCAFRWDKKLDGEFPHAETPAPPEGETG